MKKHEGQELSSPSQLSLSEDISLEDNDTSMSELSDPNFISYFSNCILDIYRDENATFRTFAQRIKDKKADLKNLPEWRRSNVEGFIGKLLTLEDRSVQYRILLSPAGLKCLTETNDPSDIYGYADVIGIDDSDIAFLLDGADAGVRPANMMMNKLSLLMGAGVWWRVMSELSAKGEKLPEESLKIMLLLNHMFGGFAEDGEPKSAAFNSGINLARRVLSGVVIHKKRGRRPKNYSDQYDGLTVQETESHENSVGEGPSHSDNSETAHKKILLVLKKKKLLKVSNQKDSAIDAKSSDDKKLPTNKSSETKKSVSSYRSQDIQATLASIKAANLARFK